MWAASGPARAKNTVRGSPLPTFVLRGYCSLRGHTKVPHRALYLLVVGKIGFGLINRDDGVLLALVRRRVVKNLDALLR